MRGRSGLKPTPELDAAMADLRSGFAALERVTEKLDFQRMSEIHIVADPDWAELWLAPRLAEFRAAYPNILFCINGAGDVQLRLGSPDLRITYGDGAGTPLFRDIYLPATGPDNPRRIADWDKDMPMEGMPLLHLKAQRDRDDVPGWVAWFNEFGQRQKGTDRGVHYQHSRVAIEAARENVGFLVCGLSLALRDLDAGSLLLPFPAGQHLKAPHPYRLAVRPDVANRPQIIRFVSWLTEKAEETARRIDAIAAGA